MSNKRNHRRKRGRTKTKPYRVIDEIGRAVKTCTPWGDQLRERDRAHKHVRRLDPNDLALRSPR